MRLPSPYLRLFLILPAFLAFAAAARAEVTGFWVFRPFPDRTEFVMPRLQGVAPEQEVRDFQTALRNDPEYRGMRDLSQLDLLAGHPRFRPLGPLPPASRRRVLIQ